MRVLIVGCGYVGLALGTELVKQGHQVLGVRRSAVADAEMKSAGITPLPADLARPEDLAKLPGPFDWIVNTVSSAKGGVEEYRQVYLQGTRNLLYWLSASPPKKFVYTSSTSVYGQNDGSLVQETSPTEPASETGRVLVETENLLRAAAQQGKFPAVILRVAAIYGPGRGHLFLRFLKNEAEIAGNGERILNMIHRDEDALPVAGNGERILNMIHRDDLVGVLIGALKSGRPGEIYNAVDDEPVAQIHFFRWLSQRLGKPMPPFSSEAGNGARKRGFTSKKVSNHRLKMELGYHFKYPTFRHGYAAEITRLERAGLLDIKLEPR